MPDLPWQSNPSQSTARFPGAPATHSASRQSTPAKPGRTAPHLLTGHHPEEAPYLNPMVRGVNFAVNIDAGLTIRAIVAVEVLKSYFGAGDDPTTWIAAVKNQMGLLEWLARLHYKSTSEPLVLTLKTVEAHLESERVQRARQPAPAPLNSSAAVEPKAQLSDAPLPPRT